MLSDWLVPGKIEKLLGVAGVAEPDSEQKAGEPSKHQASAQSVAVSQCRKGIEQKEEDLDNDNIYIKKGYYKRHPKTCDTCDTTLQIRKHLA